MADNRGLYISFTAHALLIMFLIIKVSFFTKPQLNLAEAIRVDIKDSLPEKFNPANLPNDLPEKIEKPAEPEVEEQVTATTEPKETVKEIEKEKSDTKPIHKPEPKSEPKKDSPNDKDSVSLTKSKQKQKNALEKLKKMSAIEKIRQQVRNEKSAEAAAKIYKGQVLSKGTSPTGLDKIQSENYLLQLDTLVKSNWSLPQWLIGKPLKTRVLVKINPDGKIIDAKIIHSSGNPTYDEYSLRAINITAPFPKVPAKFTEIYGEDGVVFGFPE